MIPLATGLFVGLLLGYGLRAGLAWLWAAPVDLERVTVAFGEVDRVYAANRASDPLLLGETYAMHPDSGPRLAKTLLSAAKARGMSRAQLLAYLAMEK